MSSTLDGNVHVNGALSCTTFTPPASSIDSEAVEASAGIEATKVQQQIYAGCSQESATTSADETFVVHHGFASNGVIAGFEAGLIVACVGDSTIDIDLLKNGVSVLSSAIQLTSATAIRTPAAGTVTTTSYTDGDVLEVSIDATIGTGTLGKGVFARGILREDPV